MVEISEPDKDMNTSGPSRMRGLLVALVGALVAGGGGFVATYSGLLDGVLGGDAGTAMISSDHGYTFVSLDSLMVSLGPRATSRTLKFTAELEVEKGTETAVEELRPRIMDVLNSFLRAVEESELEDPGSLAVLRAQMLRRIQIVTGEGRVRDLLILEFILN